MLANAVKPPEDMPKMPMRVGSIAPRPSQAESM